MKKLTLLLAMVMAIGFTYAQDDYKNNEVQTIFSNSGNNGGFGAVSLGYTQIDKSDAFVGGIRGGFIFDQKFAIGLGGYGFVNNLDNHYYDDPIKEDLYMAGGYGGIFIEPILAGNKPVHLSFPMLFGIGGASLTEDWENWEWEDDNYYHNRNYDSDVFFVFEPAVELEFNLARFFRVATSVSYRFTSDLNLKLDSESIDKDALRGLRFAMVFKFGKF